MKKNICILLGLLFFAFQPLHAQENYQPSPENLEAREWFQDAKFGLFIHWGIYSVLGDGEWAMQQQKIQVDDYEKLTGFFDPEEFDAEEWVSMAKEAGMKYITITSRHHDGFSMFDTEANDYDIVDGTRYGGVYPLKRMADIFCISLKPKEIRSLFLTFRASLDLPYTSKAVNLLSLNRLKKV